VSSVSAEFAYQYFVSISHFPFFRFALFQSYIIYSRVILLKILPKGNMLWINTTEIHRRMRIKKEIRLQEKRPAKLARTTLCFRSIMAANFSTCYNCPCLPSPTFSAAAVS
jgi:hypothetical protein